jgi:streptogramin lyase
LVAVPLAGVGASVAAGTPTAVGTSSAAVTYFPLSSGAHDITAGALWFSTGGKSIGRITTAGVVATFTNPAIAPIAITAGPDGALWFTNENTVNTFSIGRMTSPHGSMSSSGPLSWSA